MTETVIEDQICKKCGADVRPNSMFCYNCGGNVSVPEGVSSKNGRDFSEALPANEIAVDEKLESKVGSENSDKLAADAQDLEEKPESVSESKLKTAASMRRQTKSSQNKRVEVVWEEPEFSSIWRLVIVTILLLIFVGAIVYFGVYSR